MMSFPVLPPPSSGLPLSVTLASMEPTPMLAGLVVLAVLWTCAIVVLVARSRPPRRREPGAVARPAPVAPRAPHAGPRQGVVAGAVR